MEGGRSGEGGVEGGRSGGREEWREGGVEGERKDQQRHKRTTPTGHTCTMGSWATRACSLILAGVDAN